MTDDELCTLSAVDLAARIRRKDVSAREVMTAHLARIDQINPRVNAIVTLVAEQAMDAAARADEQLAREDAIGPLHGLPVVHKDLVDTAGILTTFGSPFFATNVPKHDARFVSRMHAAGAITCGKTNTPEFGAGSQTFNTIFGATRNPYHLRKTCGGSSGGSAVALACGMTPLADGSDMGGSLRNPAAYSNVVGLRPSPGRVPMETGAWSPLGVFGPMGRTVGDVALLLSVMAGPDPAEPLAIAEDGKRFRASLERDFRRGRPPSRLALWRVHRSLGEGGKAPPYEYDAGRKTPPHESGVSSETAVRVAWWKGLGGIPVEDDVRAVVDATRGVFVDLGCEVEEAEPDFTGVAEAFPVLRYTGNHAQYKALMRARPEWVKDTIKYEVEQAERLTAVDVSRALTRQAQMFDQSRRFFERYDYFVLPVTQLSPFDVDVPYPTHVAGTAMGSYIDWMRSCWYISFMGNPAMSVPAGFTAGGLPVGLQIVGRHRGEWELLQLAYAFEQATQQGRRRPRL